MSMPSSVFCEECQKMVSPLFAVWDGVKLNFRCPECGKMNHQPGKFRDLLGGVQIWN